MFLDEHEHVLALFRSLRFWVWWGIALVPALGAVVYRAWTDFAAAPVFVGLILAVGISVAAVQSVVRGRAITNRGIFLRRSEPIRFWGSIVLLVVIYGLVVLAILKA
jgi:integral membrane sensor domain MASE1